MSAASILKKRKAQEAFGRLRTANDTPNNVIEAEGLTDEQPRLSAFAAAKAKAATPQSASPAQGAASHGTLQDVTTSNDVSLPALLSSFPLSSAHEHDPESDPDADYYSDDNAQSQRRTPPGIVRPNQPSRISTFVPAKAKVKSDTPSRMQLVLQADETVAFVGEYDLHVLSGIVMVYGAALRASESLHRIYAPSTHALPVISAKGGPAEIAILSVDLSLGGLNKLSPLFGRLWSAQSDRNASSGDDSTALRSFDLICNTSDDPLKRTIVPLDVDQDNEATLSKLITKFSAKSRAAVVLVTGPKGSGKSTISRWLSNISLTQPLPKRKPSQNSTRSSFWLDLDPGQPEFGVPGQVSLVQLRAPLLGAPLTHPITHPSSAFRLVRSHTLAAVTPKEDTAHFLACAFDLRDRYLELQKRFPSAPLIVNCSGWVLGSGLTILLDLVQGLPLSDMVLMQPLEQDTISVLASTAPQANIVSMAQRMKPVQVRTSAESRAMQSMSYFHSLPPSKSGIARWNSGGLTGMRPWCVKYSGPDAGIMGIFCHGEAVNPGFLNTVLDGMVVAICVAESAAAFGSPVEEPQVTMSDVMEQRVAKTAEGLPFFLPDRSGLMTPLDPRFSRCIGLALVRGIDVNREELQLITPVSVTEINGLSSAEELILVRGKFDAPDWALLEDIYSGRAKQGEERPYVGVREMEQGLGGNVWRVRHLPRNRAGDVAG